jgi:hypothetical protein
VWIDDKGVYHTVAQPDPTTLMSEVFRASLDRLVAEKHEAVIEAIESEQDLFFEQPRELLAQGTPDEGRYVATAPPTKLLTDTVATIGELEVAIQSIESRWRLDALMALDDYVS